MIPFKMWNLRLFCMNAGIIALLVAGGANADVLAGGYELDSCSPHGAIFETACRGAFTECECAYVPLGSSTPEFSVGEDMRLTCTGCTPCPGAAADPDGAPLGTYYYHRHVTCSVGLPLPWLAPDPQKPSCGHTVVSTDSPKDSSHSSIVPYKVGADGIATTGGSGDWTHDCVLPGTQLVTQAQAMDGDLNVEQESTLSVGYDFTMPGSHPAATVGFISPKVVFNATCASGTPRSVPIPVNIQNQTYPVPANNSAWYPSGDQTSAATYQGAATVPKFCDDGALVRLQQGGTFSTNVMSTVEQVKVNVRWHYRDENGAGGGWSGTYSVIVVNEPI